MKRILAALLLLILLTSCSLAGKTYNYYNISFAYPRSWKPMAEVSETYQSGREYLWMGLLENLTVTSSKKEGDPGINFSVATLEHTDGRIDADHHFLYSLNEADMRDYTQRPVTVAGVDGVSADYERIWQNQWYQFHDVWLEYGPLLYLLSFHAVDLSGYQNEIDMVLESFTFK